MGVFAYQMSASGTVLATQSTALLAAKTHTVIMTLPAGNYRFAVLATNAVGNSALSARSNLVTAR